MDISIQRIKDGDRDSCIALSVTEEQSNLISPNLSSLEEADENPQCVPLGIYADGEMVGFVMYEPRGNDIFSIHRFMIDARHQRKGIGYRAMQLVIDLIKSQRSKTIYLSFRPENYAAKCLYEKLGFVFHEKETDGELVYRL